MTSMQFRPIDRTRFATAASEIARNMVIHGGGGVLTIEKVEQNNRTGLRLSFSDEGPGIESIERAMTPGYSTGHGLGQGLSGAKNLSHEFEIVSRLGHGCKVIITRWNTANKLGR